MKNYILRLVSSFLCLTLSFHLSAQNNEADTLLNISSPSRIVITESPGGSKFQVVSDSISETITTIYPEESTVASRQTVFNNSFSYDGFHIKRKRTNVDYGWDAVVDGICIGLNNATGMSGYDGLQWSKSFEIGWLSCIGVSYSYKLSSVSLGLGFDWRNYKISTSDRRMVANAEKGIEWDEYPEGVKGRNSRLKVFSLQFPLLYRLRIPDSSISIKAGPILDFNTYASLKTSYLDAGGNRCDDFTKDIEPRRFTVDFFGCVSLCNAVGIYVRYSPMKVMDAPGINFRPLTIGLAIGV